MWIRLTDEEYNKAMAKVFYSRSIIYTLLFFFGICFGEKTGIRKYASRTIELSWTQIFAELPWVIGFSILLGFICGYFSAKEIKARICEKCDKIQSNKDQKFCNCGGEFIDIKRFKWVDKSKK